MQKIIDLLIKENVLEEAKLKLFINKYSEEKLSIVNLLKVRLIQYDKMEEVLLQSLRLQSIQLNDLEGIAGIDTTVLLKKQAERLGVKYIDIPDVDIDYKLIKRLPLKQLIRYNVLPLYVEDDQVTVAFENPGDFEAKGAIERFFHGKIMEVALGRKEIITQVLGRLHEHEKVEEYSLNIKTDLEQGGAESPTDESPAVLKLIELILSSAIDKGASDLHIEATEKHCIVRYRIDGMLQENFRTEHIIFSPLSSRMKLLSNLDIAEKRKPQDGRFTKIVNGRVFDFRVSTLPTMFGESIVMRVLDKTKALVQLEDAGMNAISYKKFLKGIHAPYGIVLVTGPTGSGKTTTLYGALNEIKDVKDKTITVEDPVEYQMDGIQQVQINASSGLDFPAALRSILRQDPDKIMIGEIRDQETLRIAIQAALTGHMVISTLHTNSAVSAIGRMLDMGIESYLISGAVVAIQGQRLVRKICQSCKEEAVLSPVLLRDIKKFVPENSKFYVGKGCPVCNGSGYVGREMISEVLPISDILSTMIANGATKDELEKQAIKEDFFSMFQDGLRKAREGKTTVEEIIRVARA
ncbi:MAG: General secretion pathway protein GspE [uncultured Sulfurovum sp.]|uniref:General secretion pathway protein GspE n=1 Tax=uncultured Sulfurovum sp. TaxID=269237 RepID=A0A6S6T766_9BACT|nr:MAG: General secretion pathway protein GspE [uncultured Sulfurovum sp.]